MKAEYIDHMGSDLTVVNAARVSFDKESSWASDDDAGENFLRAATEMSLSSASNLERFKDHYVGGMKGFKLSAKDERLLYYLAKYNHWSPFSHPQITLRYTVPIVVARQEFKHTVGFTRNEISRRYVDDVPEFYEPQSWRSRPEESIKQGSGEDVDSQNQFDWLYNTACGTMREIYFQMIESGIAPEQARLVLPQGMYTSYYVTGSLAAFARMVKQRKDSTAQVEIQELANQVSDIIQPLFPASWDVLLIN